MMDQTVTVRAMQAGENPDKQAAWSTFTATVGPEMPRNADGTISGPWWVAVMAAINAYLRAAQSK